MNTHLAPQQFCTQGAPSPLLGEFVLFGQQLELHFSFVIVQQNTFIRLSLHRAFILCVVRESVLYWPAAPQVELIALHIAACSGASDTEYANAVVHGVATDCLIDTLSFIMQEHAQAIALVGAFRLPPQGAPRSTCKLAKEELYAYERKLGAANPSVGRSKSIDTWRLFFSSQATPRQTPEDSSL